MDRCYQVHYLPALRSITQKLIMLLWRAQIRGRGRSHGTIRHVNAVCCIIFFNVINLNVYKINVFIILLNFCGSWFYDWREKVLQWVGNVFCLLWCMGSCLLCKPHRCAVIPLESEGEQVSIDHVGRTFLQVKGNFPLINEPYSDKIKCGNMTAFLSTHCRFIIV